MDRGTLPAGPQDMAVDVTHRFPRWFPLSFSLSFPLWPLALAGAATMFLVQPPFDLWPAAWLAPLPWLRIVQEDRLPARWWRAAWVAGFVHWMATIHWLRLPHPATSIGWVALSAYLACYLPLFLWTARRLLHARGWPLVVAAPVAWMACEHLRGSLLGGFTFGGLGHTQWRWTSLIQVADVVGAVGVSGVVMTVAAAVAVGLRSVSRSGLRGISGSLATAAGVVAATLAYGAWRLATVPPSRPTPLEVLLVQGSIDTELKQDPDAAGDVLLHYDALTIEGLAAAPSLPDLIAWPETMWRWSLVEIDPAEVLDEAVVEHLLGAASLSAGGAVSPSAGGAVADVEDLTPEARQARARAAAARERLEPLGRYARRYGTSWLVGVDKQIVTPRAAAGFENFNCGLFLDAAGRPLDCYEKIHPVLFGEYVPLADRFPALYRLTPLPTGLTAGRRPVAVDIAGHRVAVNICYETALPAAVRSLVVDLTRTGRRPDVIVNLTNDGWFWGSSELDMHLVAAIFRAVEVRTPIVVAANTGFSAHIDGSGRLLQRGPRRATATLRASVHPDGRPALWLIAGSLPLWGCVAVVAAVVAGCRIPCRGRPSSPTIRIV
jgi:apolipoprotein N-acyltransferase